MRFSIRDLLWATLVVAMALGWWLSYRTLDGRRLEAVGQADRMRERLLSGETELIGKWKVVSMEDNGEQQDFVNNLHYEFTNDGQMIHTSDNGEFRNVYHLNPAPNPKHITVIEMHPEMTRDQHTLAYKGIYRLEGDSLTLCWDHLEDRPDGFETKNLLGRRLTTMVRVPDKAVDP